MPGHEMLMPFLPVTSKGGPYDDQAYVAGFEMGLMYSQLANARPAVTTCQVVVHTGNAAQADLIAMHYQWHIVERTDLSEGWTQLTLARSAATPDPNTVPH